ncbi:MAG: PTS sugar transporter subunit IIC [Eubacteriaceae bacterium]|nr:PTS sugar transporter subunit IIC [Eubacteriaceae bacterium]
MEQNVGFFKRKDIEISVKRYVQDALSAMALGLFSSLLIGLILKTIGQQMCHIPGVDEKTWFVAFLILVGDTAMKMMGPAIGVAVAWALKAPPLVLFSSAVTGAMGAAFTGFGIDVAGGPAGAFVAVCIGAELGKMVSRETKVDIIVTPAVTLLAGGIAAKVAGPAVGWLMLKLGDSIMTATEWQPFWFGIFIAVVVGLALTAPISSAALCIMLQLSGLAAGAATVGCCAQMVGFAVISFRANGVGGLVAQGIGTSMIQISNIIKHPQILIPPTLAGAVAGPLSTCVFKMTNNSAGAGMGTSGLVGQIMTFTDMGFTLPVLFEVLLLHIALPAVLSLIIYTLMKMMGVVKDEDLRLEM